MAAGACSFGVRPRSEQAASVTSSHEANVRFSHRFPRSGPTSIHPQPRFELRYYPSAHVFAEHDPAATAWGGECRQRSLCPNRDLSCAARAAELLDAVGVHGRTGAPVPQIAAARAERVRSLDPDIACVEREGIAAFDAVPPEGLAPTLPSPASGGGLGRGCIAVVRIEYIDVIGPKPGALVHSPGGAVGPAAASSR
jgi:hypothetical protein